MKIAAIIVTYNRKEMLLECLRHIQKGSVVPAIIIVDNDSSDGTGEAVAPFIGSGQVFYFNTGTNLGGAGGFNYGIKKAVEMGYEYFWIMDDDTLPEPDALEKILEADKILSGNYGWLSAVALWTDGKECKMNRPKLLKAFYQDIHYLKYGIIRAEQATFVGLFLRRETIMEVGLPISEFFIWGDDIEYTRRIAKRFKMPCYVAGQSIVIHSMKSNIGSNIATDRAERLERYNYAFRNENYLYRQEGIKGFGYYFAKCGKNILCSMFMAKEHRFRRAGIVAKQLIFGLFFNPKVEYIDKSAGE